MTEKCSLNDPSVNSSVCYDCIYVLDEAGCFCEAEFCPVRNMLFKMKIAKKEHFLGNLEKSSFCSVHTP